MTEAEYNQQLAKGNVDFQAAGGQQPPTQPQQLDPLAGFVAILQQLRSPASFLTTVPTFTPKTFLDQIQFYDDGTTNAVYLYINNQWVEFAASSSSGSINGRTYLNSSQSVPNSADTKIAFDTAGITNGITNDTTNHRLTVLTAGTYYISGQVTYDAPVSGKNLVAKIYVNGSPLTYNIYVANGTAIQTVQANLLITLSIGDYIELYTFHNNGSSSPLEVGSSYNYLQAFLV